MAFETVNNTSAITLGGVNKKTGKANPTTIEGYFLRTRELGPNKFNRAKTDYAHDFLTEKGEVTVFGKTNLDGKLRKIQPGTMVKVSLDGTQDTGKGNPMIVFKVQQDLSNTIEVAGAQESADYADSGDADYDDTDLDADAKAADEVEPSRVSRPVKAASTPTAQQQAKVKDLLRNRSA